MSSEVDQLMGPWGTVAPGFWDSGEQNTAAAQVQNASVTPAPVPPEIPPEPPKAPRAALEAVPTEPAAVAPAEPQPAVRPDAEAAVGLLAGPPPEYAARVTAVFRAIENKADAAGLAEAAAEAERLDQEITGRFGEVHSHSISIREMRGWLALETRQAETAVRWYLHTTGLQARLWPAGSEFITRSAERAVYAWSVIADPERSQVLSGDVLMMLQHTLGEDHQLTVKVRRHLERQAAAGQRAGLGTDRPADGSS